MVVDVIIVGGGLSGMSAAYDVHNAGKTVLVLEARDRVVGKTCSVDTVTGGRCDLGGAWFNEHTQHSITALVKKAKMPFFEQSVVGKAALEFEEGNCQYYMDHGSYEVPSTMSKEAIEDEARLTGMLDDLSKLVDNLEPWKCARAEEFDAISVQAWFESVGALSSTIQGFSAFFRCILALDMIDVSLLYLLHYFVTGGGYQSLASNDSRGGQFQRMRNGSQRVSEWLASQLPSGSVILSSPIQSIAQTDSTCTVTTQRGETFTSRAIICAIPSPLYSSIAWYPMLPIEKRCMAQRAVLGICTKVVLLYERAWWREAGRSGTASSAVGPIVQIMDTCDGDWNSEDPELKPRQFSLSCFIMGNFAVQWSELPPKERELAVKKHVVKLMEDEAAMDTIQVIEQQWMNEEFSMGAPVPAFGCGVITSVGREMRTPHDRVFFAGTEMAMRWKGYMDGAVEAGQTAAKDVVSLLGGLTDSSTTRPRL